MSNFYPEAILCGLGIIFLLNYFLINYLPVTRNSIKTWKQRSFGWLGYVGIIIPKA